MRTRLFIFIFFALGTFTSCVKSFVPDLQKYDELLVVDGVITDGLGPYTIKLSKSSRLQELSTFKPYSDCKLTIEDNVGNKTILSEVTPGVYQTDPSGPQSVPGRTYKLSILTPEGEAYESTPELLLNSLGIKKIYAELEHKNDPNLFYGRDGYQFYVDAETPQEIDNYLLWRVQCTYKFRTELSLYGYYENGIHRPIDPDTIRTCYRTIDMLNVYLLNTNEQTKAEVSRVPLNYEDNYTDALFMRYCLKVTQFKITKTAYTYWSEIKKMQDAGGDLYAQQPYQVKNNLINLTHPEKPVLGYFMTAGVSEKRLFVNKPPIVFRLNTCQKPDIKNLYGILQKRPDLWPVFLGDYLGGPCWVEPYCVDCRTLGVLEKPFYWID